jgi:hypothetical protein
MSVMTTAVAVEQTTYPADVPICQVAGWIVATRVDIVALHGKFARFLPNCALTQVGAPEPTSQAAEQLRQETAEGKAITDITRRGRPAPRG